MSLWVAIAGLVMALVPFALFYRNLPQFCAPQPRLSESESDISVSILIPARDEAGGIEASIVAALASEQVTVEIIVLDDHSTDGTKEIVQSIADQNANVRLVQSADLPEGWNGKQFACKQLAEHAKHDLMLFVDADVRLAPAAIGRLVHRKRDCNVALLSAFPKQDTGTFWEHLLIPMMHYILLCFLPFHRMRSNPHPAFAAGCGQLFLTNKADYVSAGTHEAIRNSRHDGIKLPRAFRQAGLATDVFDGTHLANCRMYHNGQEVIRGVLKNATEGIANARLIIPFTVMLCSANLLPIAALIWGLLDRDALTTSIAIAGIVISHAPRATAAVRFRQSWIGVVFHSVAVITFVGLQWVAFLMNVLGRQVAWRGRV